MVLTKFLITKLTVASIWNISLKYLIKLIRCNECIVIVNVLLSVDVSHKEPPETSNDVRNHKHNNDQTEDPVWIHHHELGLNSVCSCRLIKVWLNKSFDPTNVKQLHKFSESCKPDKTSIHTTTKENIKWERGYEIKEHPSRLEVANR